MPRVNDPFNVVLSVPYEIVPATEPSQYVPVTVLSMRVKFVVVQVGF